jgi:tetratricopeptide (TPR) repeat protein
MTCSVRLIRCALAFLLLACLDGCLPSSQSQMEEEKEPHFLAGRSCINNMDYKGAIDEFEKALEANPHSASAHFQLGWLYEEKEPDPAAAIYHYEQFLKLRPNSDNAEVIAQHITNCKQDLAKTVLPLPVTPGMQREFEQLAEENKRLQEEIEKWRAYASRLQPPASPAPSATATNKAAHTELAAQAPAPHPAYNNLPADTRPPETTSSTHTYVVKSGDSLYSIARKGGFKLEALLAANPGLDPKRLRVGQGLNLPSP